jgi:hypothetical protein
VTCVAAVSSPDESQPPRIAAGTQLGRSSVWLAKSAAETTAPPPIRPTHMLDNLGVVRELPFSEGTSAQEDWIVEKVRDPYGKPGWDTADVRHQLLSVTTSGVAFALSEGTDNPTEIRFKCEGLKVRRNGTVFEDIDAPAFNTAPYYMGTYGFFSSITANTRHDELAVVDYWPRLAGIPIFVTRLKKLTFNPQGGKYVAEKVQFEAVVANPDAVQVTEGPRDHAPDVPGFVWEAVARNAVIEVDIDLTKPNVTESVTVSAHKSRFDWTLAVNRQERVGFPEDGFDGKLVRISGTVEFPSTGPVKNALELTLAHTECEAYALERNWHLDQESNQVELKLLGEGNTVLAADGLPAQGVYRQDGFSFREPLRSDEFADQTTSESPLFLLNAPNAIDPGSLKWSRIYTPVADKERETLARAPVICVAEGKAHVLDPWTGSLLGSFAGDTPNVTDADLLTTTVNYPRGTAPSAHTYVLIGCKEGKAHLYDLASGARLMTWNIAIDPKLAGPVPDFTSVCFSASDVAGNSQILIVTAASDSKIRVFAWDSDAQVTESEAMAAKITVLTTCTDAIKGPLALWAAGNKVIVRPVTALSDPSQEVGTLIHTQPTDSVAAELVGSDIYVATVAGGKGFLWKTIVGEQKEPSETFTHPAAGTQFQCAAILYGRKDASLVFAPKTPGGSSLLWRVQQNHSVLEWELKPKGGVPVSGLAARYTPDGPRFLQCSADSPTKVSVWTTGRVLRISTDSKTGPEFNLPIQLPRQNDAPFTLKAYITPTKQLLLLVEGLPSAKGFLSPTPAWPVLVQGLYYCFLLNLSSVDRKRGKTALILWNEGDIGNSPGPAGTRALLGGILLCESIREYKQIKLFLEGGGPDITLSGVGLEVEITSSYVSKSGDLSWRTCKIATCHLVSPKEVETPFSIQLGEQTIYREGAAKDGTDGAVVTGLLTMKHEDKDGTVQCPIRMKYWLLEEDLPAFNLAKGDLSKLEIKQDAYLARNVVSAGDTHGGEAHIVIPDPSRVGGALFFKLREVSPVPRSNENGVNQFFATITLAANSPGAAAVPGAEPQPSLGFRSVKDVPLDLCLEQEVSSSIPRASTKIMQVVHRRVYGSRVRYSVSAEKYRPFGAFEAGSDTTPFDAGTWLLSPLVSVDDGVKVLEETFLLDRLPQGSPDSPSCNLVTQNLLVANRPTLLQEKSAEEKEPVPACTQSPSQDALVLPAAAVLNATTDGRATTPQPGTTKARDNEDARFQAELKKAGAAGAAILRTLSPFGANEYRFVNSPFYSEIPPETARTAESLVPLLLVAQVAAAGLLAAGGAQAGIGERKTFDFRIVLPSDLVRWDGILDRMRYVPDLPPEDPLTLDECQPVRAVRFRRGNRPGNDGPEVFLAEKVPHVHLQEAVAFRKMAPMFFLPRLGRRSEADNLFLPKCMDLTYAADKPGAVFHHILQTRVGMSSDKGVTWQWAMEPSIDFALREPQQIKVTKCVTAGVELKTASVADLQPEIANVKRLSMKWDEVLGKVGLLEIGQKEFSISLQGTELKAAGQPFQMIVQFNQDLFEIKPKDYVIPGYRVEPPADREKAVVKPASVYIVSGNDKLSDPVSTKDDKGNVVGIVQPLCTTNTESELSLKVDKLTAPQNAWRILVEGTPELASRTWVTIEGAQITHANGFWGLRPLHPAATLCLHRPTVASGPYAGNGTWKTTDGSKSGAVANASGLGFPIVITTNIEHGLADGEGVIVENVLGNTNANGTHRARLIGQNIFELWDEAIFTTPPAADSGVSRCTYWLPLNVLFRPGNPAAVSGYSVWKLDEQAVQKWQEQGMIFQVMWAGQVHTPEGPQWKQVALYEIPKLFKFIQPCMLSPKLAAVLLAKPADGVAGDELFLMQRTVLFGDSASARNGRVEIRQVEGAKSFDFVFLVKDNKEDVTVPLAGKAAVDKGIELYLLKYLPTGQTVFDSCELPKVALEEGNRT